MGISPEDIREACGYKGRMQCANSRRAEDEWPWGWDLTPGIVSVWAEADGRAVVWRRIAETDDLVREEARFRPWLVLDRLDDLRHLGGQFGREGTAGALVATIRTVLTKEPAVETHLG